MAASCIEPVYTLTIAIEEAITFAPRGPALMLAAVRVVSAEPSPLGDSLAAMDATIASVEVITPLRPEPLPVGDSLPLNVSQSAPVRKPFTPDAAACALA